jgi:hypothetical protein
MRRSYCFFLLPILVASAGCPSTDNNVGSLGKDAGAAGGPGRDASGSTAPDTAGADTTASICPTNEPALDSVCRGVVNCTYSYDCINPCRPGCVPIGPAPSGVSRYWSCQDGHWTTTSDLTVRCLSYMEDCQCPAVSPDAGVPDAPSVGQDAAQDAHEAGAAHQCQLNTDGTCSAVTPNTACTPFPGNRFDESAGCYSPVSTTLACCATLAGDYCHFAAGSGCYQIVAAGSTVTYWTPGLPDVNVAAAGGQYCDKAMGAKVPGAHSCSSTSPDAAAHDAVDAAKDAAPEASEAGAAHQCRLNADGTCSALTSNTTCTQFYGHRYDDGAGCTSDDWTSLGCCATASGESCGLPTQTGCYQLPTDGGTVAYWTPNLATPAVTIPGVLPCDGNRSSVVPSAHSCRLPPDGAAPLPLPTCGSDSECCVSVDQCMARAQLGGTGPGPAPQPDGGSCLACIPPAIQVQCVGGYCVGTRVTNLYDSSSPLFRSHCGYVALPDAGTAPPVSHHALTDGGVSYQTSWSCGGP